jgi:Spy/CpxP family protein refolding chaperone
MWAIAVAVLAVMILVFARADALGRRGWRGHGQHHRGPASYLAHELKLNDAQREKIQAIWQMERPAVAARIQEFLAENKEMNAISVEENPDMGKVQAIANREGATIAALLVEKEQLQSKIYWTVLNPEQRAKADQLQKKWESRLDHAADRFGMKSEK